MGLLFRYVLARYSIHISIITALMVGLYLAVDAPERIGGGAWTVLARIPLMVSHVLPVAAGAALLTAFLGMRSSGALRTLRASGVGWPRILLPALAGGLAAALLEAALSLVLAPAALAACAPPAEAVRPGWILDRGIVLRVSEDGGMEAWRPGHGMVEPPGNLEHVARDLEALSDRVPAERASAAALVRVARLEERLGHDPRQERVELWTRILLPCALVMVLVTCATSIRREHPGWRAAARLVIAFAAGWLCLALATQLFLSGVAPGWCILALPAGVLAVLSLL